MKKFIFALAILLLTACGAPDSGTITEKAFVPEHDVTDTQMICGAYGQYGCTVYVPVITTTHYDDDWQFKIDNGDDNGWVSVDKCLYDMRYVGDTWTEGDSCNG